MAGSLAIAACCLSFFNRRPIHIKVLGFYAITSVAFSLAQFFSAIFLSNAGISEIGNAYVLTELLLFSAFYFYSIMNSGFQKGVLIAAGVYTGFYIIVFLFFVDRALTLIRFGRDSMMIFYALVYFYYLIKKLPEENLLKFPAFWVNSAVIFFFSGTLFLSLFRDYIVTVLKDDISGFWAFRNFFRFAFCLVVSYAGWIDLQLYLKQSRKSI